MGNHTSTLSSGQHSSLQHGRGGVRQEGYRIGVDEERVCLSELLQYKVGFSAFIDIDNNMFSTVIVGTLLGFRLHILILNKLFTKTPCSSVLWKGGDGVGDQ